MITIKKKTTVIDILKQYHLSKPLINKVINNAYTVYINGIEASSKQTLEVGDTLDIDFQDTTDIVSTPSIAKLKQIKIIYEDSNMIVVNKPCGMLVHSDGETNETLLNYLTFYLEKKNQLSHLRPVHRLDVETSGLIILSKNLLAHCFLNYQMENKMIERKYIARVKGIITTPGVIDKPIGRNRHISNQYIIFPGGKKAVTKYRPISSDKQTTLLDITIETGRTHQIRLHLSSIHHPIIGDLIYNDDKATTRMKLHSYHLRFLNPNDMSMVIFTSKEEL